MTERKQDKRKTAGDTPNFNKLAQSRGKGKSEKSKELSKPGRYTGEFSPNRMFLGIEDLIVKSANLDDDAPQPKKGQRLREQIDYPGGRTRLLRYDKQGELKEIVYQDRKISYLDSWVRTGDIWMHYDAAGQATGNVLTGVVRLDEFGNLRFEDLAEGTTRIERSDGATTFLPGDGSAVTSERGRVQKIAYSNQNSTSLSYDEHGKLTGMRTPDGANWRNTISTEWLVVDDAGNPVDEDTLRFDGEVSIEPNGTLTMVGSDGSVITIATSGTKSILNSDLSRIVMNAAGAVESITPRAIPGVWQFSYEGAQLKGFTYNGINWTREQGTTWRRSDTTDRWNGEVSVQPSGQIIFREQGRKPVTASASGAVLEKRIEGGVRVINADGSVVIVDGHGLVIKVVYPDGSERGFEYDDNGDLINFTYTDASKTFFDSYRLKDSAWIQYQNGKETGRTLKGRPEVLQSSAEFAYQDTENAVVVVHRPDGSRMILSDALVVQEVKNAAGLVRSFSFDSTGRLVLFSDSTGTWTSKDGSKWNDERGASQVGQAAVAEDGTFTWKDSKAETVFFTDGFRLVRSSGSNRLYDSKGRIVEFVTAKGDLYKFGYDSHSLIRSVTRPDGIVMTSEDHVSWNIGGDDIWTGLIRVTADGAPVFFDLEELCETIYGADGSETSIDLNPQSSECGRQFIKEADGRLVDLKASVDFDELNDAAQRLLESLESGAGDLETVRAVLEQLSLAERKAIIAAYEKLSGAQLEAAIIARISPGPIREELLAMLWFHDTNQTSDFAGSLRQLLASEEVVGDSSSVHQQLMRLLSSLTVSDVFSMNYFFALHEPYITAAEAIESTEQFPISVKKAARIYMKGEELLTDGDRQSLAELSVELSDLEMLHSTVSKMTVQERAAFVAKVGEEKLNATFNGDWQSSQAKKFSKAKTGR